MNDELRFENIKLEFEMYRELSESDEKWLIEKLEEQQKLIEEWYEIAKENTIEMLRYHGALKEIVNIKNTYAIGDDGDSFMSVDDPYLYKAIKIAEKGLNDSIEN